MNLNDEFLNTVMRVLRSLAHTFELFHSVYAQFWEFSRGFELYRAVSCEVSYSFESFRTVLIGFTQFWVVFVEFRANVIRFWNQQRQISANRTFFPLATVFLDNFINRVPNALKTPTTTTTMTTTATINSGKLAWKQNLEMRRKTLTAVAKW